MRTHLRKSRLGNSRIESESENESKSKDETESRWNANGCGINLSIPNTCSIEDSQQQQQPRMKDVWESFVSTNQAVVLQPVSANKNNELADRHSIRSLISGIEPAPFGWMRVRMRADEFQASALCRSTGARAC